MRWRLFQNDNEKIFFFSLAAAYFHFLARIFVYISWVVSTISFNPRWIYQQRHYRLLLLLQISVLNSALHLRVIVHPF